MADLFALPARATDSDGNPLPGAKLFFYRAGGTTPATVYADGSLATPLSNPVVADSAGFFPAIYTAPTRRYRAVCKNAAETQTLFDFDPVGSNIAGDTGELASGVWSKLPAIYKFLFDGSGTVTIDTRDRDGEITNSAATYTVDGQAEEFPYFNNAYEIRAVLTGTATIEVI